MSGWILLVLWAVAWIEIGRRIRKASGSWITTIGGGFLASLVGILAVMLVWRGIELSLGINPNPKVRNWQISEPKPEENWWDKGKPDPRERFDPYASQPNSSTSRTRTVVSSAEYGSRWPFTVSRGELECHQNAVIMHTAKGIFSINGKAMDRYAGRYPEWRRIAKPYPGLENDPAARMPPPSDLIQKGLALCRR